jgi:hypothetical protein
VRGGERGRWRHQRALRTNGALHQHCHGSCASVPSPLKAVHNLFTVLSPGARRGPLPVKKPQHDCQWRKREQYRPGKRRFVPPIRPTCEICVVFPLPVSPITTVTGLARTASTMLCWWSLIGNDISGLCLSPPCAHTVPISAWLRRASSEKVTQPKRLHTH